MRIALLAGLLAWIYHPAFLWMWDRWFSGDSYYAHGWLIPFVTLYWIYKKKAELTAAPAKPDAWALPGLAAAVAIQLMASILQIYFLSAVSFVLIVFFLVQFLAGRRAVRAVWFPIAFLFLMVPLPLLAISEITLKMKFFVTDVSVYWLSHIGIAAAKQGSYILMPNAYLLVGDPCSGLKSFLSFLCLGLIFAYHGSPVLWKKGILVAASLALAIFSNVLRVFGLSLGAELYGMEAVDGAVHDASGFLTFAVAFIILMLLQNSLNDGEKRHASVSL